MCVSLNNSPLFPIQADNYVAKRHLLNDVALHAVGMNMQQKLGRLIS